VRNEGEYLRKRTKTKKGRECFGPSWEPGTGNGGEAREVWKEQQITWCCKEDGGGGGGVKGGELIVTGAPNLGKKKW